jgi:phage-related protein
VGLGLLSGPVGVVIAAVTALAMAAYYVWKNWATIGPRLQAVWEQLKMVTENVAWFIGEVFKRIVSGLISLFSGMWEGIEQGFTDAVAWIDSWSGGAMTAAINGIKDGWNALTGWFNDIWNSIEGRLNRFVQTAQRILGPIIAIVDRIRAALPGGGSPAEGAAEAPPQVLGNVRARQGAGRAAVGGYYADPLPTGGGTARLNGNLQIGLEPGLVLRSADSDQPGVAVTGSQGPVLGRQ